MLNPYYRKSSAAGTHRYNQLLPKSKPKRNPPRQTEPRYRRQHLSVYLDDQEFTSELRGGVMKYHLGSLSYDGGESLHTSNAPSDQLDATDGILICGLPTAA